MSPDYYNNEMNEKEKKNYEKTIEPLIILPLTLNDNLFMTIRN